MKPKSDISRQGGGHYLQPGRAAGKARRLRRVSQSAYRQARHGRLWAEWVQGCGQRALCCPCSCAYVPKGCPHEIRASTYSQQRSCRRHDKAVASGWRWADEASPAPMAPETVFVAVHLSCDCPSKPPSASRAGQAVKGAICRASRRGFRGISSPGKKPPGSGIPRPRNPVCHASLQPPKRPALSTLFEAAPKGRTSQKRRTTMATKTNSTTNDAGCSPCTPEAHQRTVFQTQPDRGERS